MGASVDIGCAARGLAVGNTSVLGGVRECGVVGKGFSIVNNLLNIE